MVLCCGYNSPPGVAVATGRARRTADPGKCRPSGTGRQGELKHWVWCDARSSVWRREGTEKRWRAAAGSVEWLVWSAGAAMLPGRCVVWCSQQGPSKSEAGMGPCYGVSAMPPSFSMCLWLYGVVVLLRGCKRIYVVPHRSNEHYALTTSAYRGGVAVDRADSPEKGGPEVPLFWG